ncbi:zinc finger protein 319 [Diaphorina citri]|uniref:Zinc finger protein 319 n=1 Tax=Diaphorina citri TaxID=121845 RepID=A0A1S3DHF8_DIACI|nr:zinc finger protein 319 [Diaphorina citri]
MSCFICDEKVGNDKVHLATGIAPHSKLGLPAKISNLIGDDFVVVVTQSDHVCRRCSALINHMDKLETELSYVKKAITGYIRTKYNLPFDEESKNAVVNGEVSPAKKPRKTPPTPISKPATNIAPLVSPAPKAAPPPSQEDTPKLKIYKCGFCSFQSKDLNSVRLHMRVHIKPKTDEAKKTTVSTPSTPTAASAPVAQPTPPPQQNIVRKKLFRCQVCSASFVDRKSCLQHIKLTHSKASSSNKENEQSTATATSENTQPEEPMDTQTSDVNTNSQEPTSGETSQGESQEWTEGEKMDTDNATAEVPPAQDETAQATDETEREAQSATGR